MFKRTSPLDRVKVAAPCPADWNRMRGDERVRFCDSCSLNVYNLSGMTRREAEALVVRTEGRLCVRYYRRADGTILTDDCPVGLRALRRRMSRVARAAASSVLGFLAGLGLYTGLRRDAYRAHVVGGMAVMEPQKEIVTQGGVFDVPPRDEPLMGKFAPAETEAEEYEPTQPVMGAPVIIKSNGEMRAVGTKNRPLKIFSRSEMKKLIEQGKIKRRVKGTN